jgi:hypothetical protein
MRRRAEVGGHDAHGRHLFAASLPIGRDTGEQGSIDRLARHCSRSVGALQPLDNQPRHLRGPFAMQEMAAPFDQRPLVRTLEELLLPL